MAEKSSKAASKKGEQMSQEKIISKFQQLRMEQRAVANKIAELEADKNEHKIVIDALKKVDPERRCFHTVGGVLVERTVKDVLPALENNSEQLSLLVDKFSTQLSEKGKELNIFKEKHNIRFHDESSLVEEAKESSSTTASNTPVDTKSEPAISQGVLIS